MVVCGFVIQEEVTSATFVFNSSFDNPISEYNKLKPLLSEDYRLEKNFNFSLKDLVNLSINHLSLYGEEIDLMKNHETFDGNVVVGHGVCKYCNQEQYSFGYNQENYNELENKKDKPLINYFLSSKFNCEEAEKQNVFQAYHGFDYNLGDKNLLPSLTLNGQKIYWCLD